MLDYLPLSFPLPPNLNHHQVLFNLINHSNLFFSFSYLCYHLIYHYPSHRLLQYNNNWLYTYTIILIKSLFHTSARHFPNIYIINLPDHSIPSPLYYKGLPIAFRIKTSGMTFKALHGLPILSSTFLLLSLFLLHCPNLAPRSLSWYYFWLKYFLLQLPSSTTLCLINYYFFKCPIQSYPQKSLFPDSLTRLIPFVAYSHRTTGTFPW